MLRSNDIFPNSLHVKEIKYVLSWCFHFRKFLNPNIFVCMLPIYIKPVFLGVSSMQENCINNFLKHIWSITCNACIEILNPGRKSFSNLVIQEGGRELNIRPPSRKFHTLFYLSKPKFLIKCLNFFCTKYVTWNKILLHFRSRCVNFIGEQFPSIQRFEKVRHQVLNSNHHVTLVKFQMKGYSTLTTFIYLVYSKAQDYWWMVRH